MDRINGAGTIDIGGGRRGFVDEDLGVGQEGTEVTALWLNMTQEEMIKVIETAGLVLNPSDWTQLWQALQILGLSAGARSRRWTAVISMTLTSAPGAPTAGDTYLVPTGATGIWATQVGKIAEWNGTAWYYFTPADGHGISLPDGRVFERIGGTYLEKLALDAQSGKWNYAIAGGTANALTATISPAPAGLLESMDVRVRVTALNTGPATLNLNGMGAKPILSPLGQPLNANDLTVGSVAFLRYNAAADAFVLLGARSGIEAVQRAAKPSYISLTSTTISLAASVFTSVPLAGSQFFSAGGTTLGASSMTIGAEDGGLWQLNLSNFINDSTAQGSVGAFIRINGVDRATGAVIRDTSGAFTKAANASAILPLVAGDVVTFVIVQSNMGSTRTMDRVNVSAARVGSA